MTFTQIPQEYAPLGGPIRYALALDTPQTIDLQVYNDEGALIGAKRYAEATSLRFDAAPILRRAVRYRPVTAATGIYAATGRIVTAYIEALEVAATNVANRAISSQKANISPATVQGASSQEPAIILTTTGQGTSFAGTETVPTATVQTTSMAKVASEVRTFLPCMQTVIAPALLTTGSVTRILSEGESDELTFVSKEAIRITVTTQAASSTSAQHYQTAAGGVFLFRLNTADFPEAETLTVDAGACGVVNYTVIAPVIGARRLAWRSRAGSIEHYTFPVEKETTVEVAKKRIYGAQGYQTTRMENESCMTLVSAFEPRARIEALSEILASPEVWLVDADNYTKIDVMTERSTVHRNGAVSCLEVAIRLTRKEGMPWN